MNNREYLIAPKMTKFQPFPNKTKTSLHGSQIFENKSMRRWCHYTLHYLNFTLLRFSGYAEIQELLHEGQIYRYSIKSPIITLNAKRSSENSVNFKNPSYYMKLSVGQQKISLANERDYEVQIENWSCPQKINKRRKMQL